MFHAISYNVVNWTFCLTLSLSSVTCLYVIAEPPANPGLLGVGLAKRSGSDNDEGLVESGCCLAIKLARTGLVDELALFVGLTVWLIVSCLDCRPLNTGLVEVAFKGFERTWLTSAKSRAGSGGLAEDNGLEWGVTLDGESWNIDWGLEGCILIVTGVCLGSGPKTSWK